MSETLMVKVGVTCAPGCGETIRRRGAGVGGTGPAEVLCAAGMAAGVVVEPAVGEE